MNIIRIVDKRDATTNIIVLVAKGERDITFRVQS